MIFFERGKLGGKIDYKAILLSVVREMSRRCHVLTPATFKKVGCVGLTRKAVFHPTGDSIGKTEEYRFSSSVVIYSYKLPSLLVCSELVKRF